MTAKSSSAIRTCFHLLLFMSAAFLCSAQAAQSVPESSQRQDIDSIRHLISLYAESVDKADPALASQVWLDSPEVSFVHPLGHEHGFQQIKRHVYEELMGETFTQRGLSIHDIAIHPFHDSAWAEFYWDFTATLRSNGQTITNHGRETQVYWKVNGRWRLVQVHYSGMPLSSFTK